MIKYIIYSIFMIGAIGAAIGFWHIERALNFKLSYENLIEAKIKEMVKEEALID